MGAGRGLVGLDEHREPDVTGGDGLGRGLLVGVNAEELVGVVEVSVLIHSERDAADEVRECHQHALGAALGHVHVGLDGA